MSSSADSSEIEIIDFICDLCKNRFDTPVLLENHICDQVCGSSSSISFKCYDCNTTYKTHDFLFRHWKNVHYKEEEKEIVYQKPTIVVKLQKQNIQQFFSTHCEICNHTFRTVGGLKLHTSKLHSLVKYNCLPCKTLFHVRKRFIKHNIEKHWMLWSQKIIAPGPPLPVHPKIYICFFCKTILQSQIALAVHIKYVHQNLMFVKKMWKNELLSVWRLSYILISCFPMCRVTLLDNNRP